MFSASGNKMEESGFPRHCRACQYYETPFLQVLVTQVGVKVGLENSLGEPELSVDFNACCGYWSGYGCDLGRNG